MLSIATLATLSMAQKLDTIWEEEEKRFMHHYNMPPYSTGDARAARSTNRREYGHGALVEKALQCVIPPVEEFPYAIRVEPASKLTKEEKKILSARMAEIRSENGGKSTVQIISKISLTKRTFQPVLCPIIPGIISIRLPDVLLWNQWKLH